MLNDPRIHMNVMPPAALMSLSNMGRYQISSMMDQQLPGLLLNPHMPLPSSSLNMGFPAYAYSSSLQSSNAASKVLANQYEGSSMEPSSSSAVHHKAIINDNSMGASNHVGSFQWDNDGLSQKILAQPNREANGAPCLSTHMNDEMNSAVSNPLDQALDQLDSSAAPPVDFDSFWNIRENLF